MSKRMVGIYDTPEATVSAIEELTFKGNSPTQISVITRNQDTSFIETKTNAEIHTSTNADEVEPASFLDKVKTYLTDSEEEPEGYEDELQSGKYLVFLDTNKEPDDQVLDSSRYDNNEVDVMPSQTMNTTFERKKVEWGRIKERVSQNKSLPL